MYVGIYMHVVPIKNCSDIQDLIRGDTQTHRQHTDRISLLLCPQNKERRLELKTTKGA
jgi:hypothetical protein